MSRWFRHYAGMMRDPKLVGIAVRSKQPIERVLFLWNCILESAAEANTSGTFLIDGDEIAYFLRCDKGDVSAVLLAMEDATVPLIKDGQIVKWSCRQFESDSDPTAGERQTRRRARLKAERERDGTGVTDESRVTGVTQTDQSRAGHTAHRTETDTDLSSSLRSDDAPAKKKSEPQNRGSRIPDDFAPDETTIASGIEAGHSREHILGVGLEEFRDYWRGESGARARKLNWQGTYRSRLRMTAPRRPPARAGPFNGPPKRNPSIVYLETQRENYDQSADEPYVSKGISGFG